MIRNLLILGGGALLALSTQGQVFTSPRLDAVTSWIGNSYGGRKKCVQQDIHAIAVTPDGTVFTNVGWDEAGGNVGEYRDGEWVRSARHTHGWGNEGGEAIGFNSHYLFIAMAVGNEGGGLKDPDTWPPKSSKWLGVSRRQRTDITKGAPFDGGKGGKGDSLKSTFLVVTEIPDKSKEELQGLCANETRLYVADPHDGAIKVYDTETMQPAGQWKTEQTGPLALDAKGSLWMLVRKSESNAPKLVSFNPDGKVSATYSFAEGVDPIAFCFAADGRLLVADDSAAQQIRIYQIQPKGLHETGTFGEHGGIASGVPGAFADRKLNHVTALGTDAKGNLYLSQDAQSGGGGTALESYRLENGALNWRLFGLTFVDMAEIDAADDRDVFTKEEHVRLDWSQPAGREWSYAGYTIGRFKFPEDPRLHLWSGGAWVRRIGGQRILFVNDMNGENLQVYRFAPATDGEVAIPSGFFAKKHLPEKGGWPPHQPEKGEWIWHDGNGNGAFDAGEFESSGAGDTPASQGWWVDRSGGIWLATEKKGIRYFPAQGLDERGNPRWSFEKMRTFPHPAEFLEVKRLRYDAATDMMVLGGTTAEDKNQHWKPMGPVLACYEGWLRGVPHLRWRITLPYAHGASGHESCEPMGFDVAGDFVFVPYTGAAKKENVKTGRVEIFRTRDGSAAGHVEPGDEVGEIGLQDLRETLTAHHREDGEYVVLLEDDAKSKVVMYRLRDLK